LSNGISPWVWVLLAALLLLGLSAEAVAATTGSEWGTLFNRLAGFTQGFLGRSLALAALLAGIGLGIAQANAYPAVVGLVVCLMCTVFPSFVNGMLTALV